jgi:hypothetical protein
LRIAVRLILCLTGAALPAAAQNNFILTINSKPAGKCSYTIEKTKDGEHIKSKLSYHLSPSATPTAQETQTSSRGRSSSADSGLATDYQFVEDYKLDANNVYAGGFMTDMKTLANTTYTPSKDHDKLIIAQNQNGSQSLANPIDIKPNFVMLFDYDPSAIQAVLLETASNPAEKDLYLAVIPKRQAADPVPALWLTNQPEAHGTLDGKPVTLHHYILRLYKSQYDVFADDTNTLMLATSTALSAIYTRENFVLTSTK